MPSENGSLPAAARDALAAASGTPTCAVCGQSPDFYLYRPERTSQFACWEHVSPVVADVDAEPADAGPAQPVAIPVSDDFR